MARLLGARSDAAASDAVLLSRTRSGNTAAYAELWDRHSKAGLRAAYSFRELADPEDLVSEAFMQILRTIQQGKGPRGAFRPYLYTVIRNLALRSGNDQSHFADADLELIPDDDSTDRAIEAALNNTLLVTAFRSLPDRWQTVLWYTEVDRLPVSQVAVLTGMNANAVSALAFRARRALRAAWLQAHVDDTTRDDECRNALSRFGEYAKGNLGPRERAKVEAHLSTCMACRIITEEAADSSSRLALVLIPLVLGAAASVKFLHAAPSGAALAMPARPPYLPAGPSPKTTSVPVAVAGGTLGVLVLAGAATAISLSMAPSNPPTAAEPGNIVHSLESTRSSTEPTSTPVATRANSAQAEPVAAVTRPTSHPTPTPTPLPTTTPQPTATPTPTPTPTPSPTPTTEPPTPITAAPVVDPASVPSITNSLSPVISGTGVPGAQITISRGAQRLGTVSVSASGSWSWTASALVEGSNALSFVQTVPGTLPSSPTLATIVIDTIAPAPPTVADTWSAATASPAFHGTAEPDATVRVLAIDGTELGSTVAASDGSWTIPPVAGLDPSTRHLLASQTDVAGNVSATAIVGPFAFVPVLTSPADGASLSGGSVPIELDGWPDAVVTISWDGSVLGTRTLDATGHAHGTIVSSDPLSVLPPGPHTITLSYQDTVTDPTSPLATATTAITLVP